VSTHSPDFLNAVEIGEAFWLVKEQGYTAVRRAEDDPQIVAHMNDGDKLGFLWKEGLFAGVDPR
jgi:predicted ATPase